MRWMIGTGRARSRRVKLIYVSSNPDGNAIEGGTRTCSGASYSGFICGRVLSGYGSARLHLEYVEGELVLLMR